MKIVIISDIHGNDDALRALPEGYDELWVLGDLVNYGPEPGEVVTEIMDKAAVVVRGNRDDAVVSTAAAPWKNRWRVTAEASKQFTAHVLSKQQKAYIRSLPLHNRVERKGTFFFLVHATPSDPLYGHHSTESDEWAREVKSAAAQVLLVGHSHVPFTRVVDRTLVLNPGASASLAMAIFELPMPCSKTANFHLELTPILFRKPSVRSGLCRFRRRWRKTWSLSFKLLESDDLTGSV
jgi:putative phosphoesterase